MQTREEITRVGINRDEDIEDGGQMCLPMCSDRRYTSNKTHLGFFLSVSLCATFFPVSAMLLGITFAMSSEQDEEVKDFTLKLASAVGGAAFSTLSTAVGFFVCGTKKNNKEEIEPDEESQLLPGPKR